MKTLGRNVVTGEWEYVTSDNGNEPVWFTTLCQVLKCEMREQPFNNREGFGIPTQDSIINRLMPDYYLSRIQQQFSEYFPYPPQITRVEGYPVPTYKVSVTLTSQQTLEQLVN